MEHSRLDFRHNVSAAAEVLRSLLPVPESLAATGRLVAEIVDQVNVTAPASWELTLRRHNFYLNVGQVAVLIVRRSDLWIYTTPFPTRPRGVLRRRKVQYAALDVPCDILEVAPASIALVEPQVTRRLRSFAKAAALAKSRSPWKTAHSPAAVEALGAACGREIEQPSYSADSVAAADQPAASDITDTLEAQRRVERAAIEAVTAEYRRLGWTVRSVEKDNCGYDLRCSRGREVACIEVKGRAKEGDRVILSSNEWDHRTDKGWRLAIVSGATSSHPVIEEFPGKALTTRFEVDPVAYRLTRRV